MILIGQKFWKLQKPTISWLKENQFNSNQPLVADGEKIINRGYELIINNLETSDSGRYTCLGPFKIPFLIGPPIRAVKVHLEILIGIEIIKMETKMSLKNVVVYFETSVLNWETSLSTWKHESQIRIFYLET